MANGRAKALGHTEGRVKILADAATDRVLRRPHPGRARRRLDRRSRGLDRVRCVGRGHRACVSRAPDAGGGTQEAALAVDGRTLNL